MRAAALLAVLILLVPLVFLPPPAAGDGEPAAEAATAYNTQRKIARDAAGDIFVAYVRATAAGPRVFVALSRDNGRTWGDLTPPTSPSQPSDRATLALDSRGALHLAWTETAAPYRQVFYASYQQGVWSPPFKLSDTQGYSGYPSVAVDSRDRVHVVWYGYDGQAYQVSYRFLEGGQWSRLQLLTSGRADALNPALGIAPDDSLHVVFYRLNAANTAVYYLTSRNGWATPQTLSDPRRSSWDPTVALDALGVVHVAWSTASGNESSIMYRSLSKGTWSSPVMLDAPGASADHASLAVDAAGRLYVLWDQEDGQLYMVRWAGAWGSPEALTHGGNNTYPTTRWATFAGGPAGQLDYAWTQEVGGKLQLAFGNIALSPVPAPPPSSPSTLPVALGALGAAGAAVAATAGVLLLRRRRGPKA